ncbi:MAG: flagellar hook-length control protein FliK [Planctomycetota bacterium]
MNTALTATAAMEVPPGDTMVARRRGQSAPAPGTSPVVGPGFDAIMSAVGARRGRVGMIAPGGERVSPERMFDAPPSDPGERRQATLRDDYREGAAKDADALRDRRTGIEARRTSSPTRNDGGNGAQPSEADAAFRVQMADRAKPASFQGQTAAVPGGELRSGHEGQAIESPVDAFKNADQGENFLGRSSAESDRASQGSPGGPPPLEKVGGVGTSTTSANTAAGEVARLLAGAHPSDVESAAAPAAAPASGEGRPAAREASENPKAKPNPSEQSATSPSTSRKAEETRGTPFAQLVRLMRSQAGRQSSARVMLDPPELGRIHVRVKMLGDRVEVGVETETAAAKELLSGRADRLKSALEQHGMIVDRFDINTNATGLFDQRQAVGGGSDFSAQSGGERPASPGAPGARAGGRAPRPPRPPPLQGGGGRGEDLRAGVGTPVSEPRHSWRGLAVGSSVVEWSAAGDVRLDIRV